MARGSSGGCEGDDAYIAEDDDDDDDVMDDSIDSDEVRQSLITSCIIDEYDMSDDEGCR